VLTRCHRVTSRFVFEVEFVDLEIVLDRLVRVDYLSGKAAITDRVVANPGAHG
jgi:hypothetical protein